MDAVITLYVLSLAGGSSVEWNNSFWWLLGVVLLVSVLLVVYGWKNG